MKSSNTWSVALGCLSVLACGARSALDEHTPSRIADGSHVDASFDAPDTTYDAGVDSAFDAGSDTFDASIPVGCVLVPVWETPMILGRERDGVFDAPQTVYRDGRFDLLVTFFPEDDDRAPLSYGSRYDARLEPAGGLAGGGNPSTTMWAAGREDRLGLCFRRLVSGVPQITSFRGGEGEWTTTLPGDRCEGVAGNGGQWLVAISDGGEIWGHSLDEGGNPTRPPTVLVRDGDSRDPLRVSVTAFDDGFAWTGRAQHDRRLPVGVIDADGGSTSFTISEVFPAFAVPAIAPWPYGSGQLVVANHDSGGVRLFVARPGSDAMLRSEPLAFSMGGDVTPALLPLHNGLLVAMLNYGDFDPSGGNLEIVSVDSNAEITSTFTLPTRRSFNLARGGISAATDGDTIVVHWAEMIREGDLMVPVTKGMTFTCE